jgi:hypothetical protein
VTSLLRCWLALAECVTGALLDPRRREGAVLVALLAFAALYTLVGCVALSSRDVHFDLGELIAWSREPALGYNHPPLSVWVAQAWFAAFPLRDWAAYLLGTSVSAVALWISWRLFSEWLDEQKRVAALAMLMLIPFYAFHALIFNANIAMLPFWAAASLFFLRAVLRRDAMQGAFAGIAAAGAMLAKYWSVYLLAGLGLAALVDPRRTAFLRSTAPWIGVAAGLVVLAPHLVYVATGGGSSLTFALGTASGAGAARLKSVSYLLDVVAYATVPLIAFAATRPSRAAIADVVRPSDRDRRLVAMVWLLPLVLPAVVNLMLPGRLTGVWTIPNWTLLPLVLLGPPLIVISRRVMVGMVAAAMALPLAALLAAPGVALGTHFTGVPGYQAHYRLLASAVEKAWRRTEDRPLKLVGGEHRLAHGIAFYLPDRPTALPDHLLDAGGGRTEIKLTESSAARIARDGIAFVCPVRESYCVSALDKVAHALGGRREQVELARAFLGLPGRPEQYVIVIVEPTAA